MCLKGPKKQKASQGEIQLAQLARQQWQHFQTVYRPVEDAHLESVERMDTPGKRALSVGRAVSASRSQVGGTIGPSRRGGQGHALELTLGESERRAALTGAAGAGDSIHTQGVQDRRVQALSLGRGQSVADSEVARRVASHGAGLSAAKTAASNLRTQSIFGAAGTAVGAAGTVYALNRWSRTAQAPQQLYAGRPGVPSAQEQHQAYSIGTGVV